MIYFNCQGFLNNKDEICILIKNWRPVIVCLVETHVDENTLHNEISIDGYKFERCNTENKRTGGILIFIREEIKFKLQLKENYERIWIMAISVEVSNCKYLITTVYRSPNSNDVVFLEYFDQFLESNINFNGTQVIVGDFNYDWTKDTFYSRKCRNVITQYGLYQIVKEHTRVTDKSKTLIDYVITNNKYFEYKVHITPTISDHRIISLKLNLQSCFKQEKIEYWSYANYDKSKFQNMLVNMKWNNSVTDTDTLTNDLLRDIRISVSSMRRKEHRCVPARYSKNKWISSEIIEKMKERDRKYKAAALTGSQELWDEFKLLRNKVTHMIRVRKEKYYNDILDANKDNPKELWKNLKCLLPERNKECPSHVCFGGYKIEEEDSIANRFNEYFIESIEDIVISITNYHTEEDIIHGVDYYGEFSAFEPIDMKEIKIYMKQLRKGTTEQNGIPTSIMKDAFDVVANRFLDVVNSSLKYGVFPENLKNSTVIPIAKVVNTTKCEEFRPVNTVPQFEKVIELAVKNQLIKFCDKKSVIVPNQSGFRNQHSCESVIINVCDKWLRAIDRDEVVVAVFLDFRRAFETVNRGLLLKKLDKMGLDGVVYSWFESYLKERTQNVKIKNCYSKKLIVSNGVVQGTVLGPILFVLYINDLVKYVRKSNVAMFADDTMIYTSGKNVVELCNIINDDLELLNQWLGDNKLCVNVKKCKYIVLGSRYMLSEIDTLDMKILMNNSEIEKVKEIKYLGVKLDESLSFKSHFEYVLQKMSQKVGFLNRVGRPLSLYINIVLYRALVSPHLEYCASVLFNLKQGETERLQKIQNRAMRAILKCSRYTPIHTMIKVLNFMTVKQRIIYKTLDIVHKIKNQNLPSYLSEGLRLTSDVHSYNTRTNTNFFIETFNRCRMQDSLFSKGLKLYNELPNTIKECDVYYSFKKQLSKYVKDNF